MDFVVAVERRIALIIVVEIVVLTCLSSGFAGGRPVNLEDSFGKYKRTDKPWLVNIE